MAPVEWDPVTGRGVLGWAFIWAAGVMAMGVAGVTAVTPGSEALDADPHATTSYYNTGFDNDRGYAYYHPARNDGAMP